MKKSFSIKIGVSGKREIPPEERDKVYKEIKASIQNMLRHCKCEDFTGYTALAAGADTIFAAVVIEEFRQPLAVVLPFPQEEYEKDFTAEELAPFRLRLGQAANCEVVEALPSDAGQRNEAYFKAGKTIADRCDELVIVWDGLRPGGVGGTAEILGYWAEKNKQYPVAFIKVKALKADLLHEELIRSYRHANRVAIKARNRYRRVWKWVILLGWLTVGCFAVKTAFSLEGDWGRLLTLLEFLFVTAVYSLIFLARKKDFHGKYLRERMKAETYRLMRAFYHAGVLIGISDRSREEESSLVELAANINRRLASDATRSGWYTQYVIRCLLAEQCAYHEAKMKSIGNRNQVYERINFLIGVLFIVNLAVHLAHLYIIREGVKEMWLYKFSVFFNLLLPASYAALEGIIYFNEWSVLKKYSTSADYSLKEADGLLPTTLDRSSAEENYKIQAQVLHLVSGIMLTDNRNWNLLLENKDTYRMIV